MNPIIDEYLKKYNQDAENVAAAEAESQKSGLGWAQFGASIGDAFAGRSPNETAKNFDQIRKSIDDNTVGRYLQNKKAAQDEMEKKQKFEQFDPNSNSSIAYKKFMEAKYPDLVKAYGDKWSIVSAGDADTIFKPLNLIDQSNARRQAANQLAVDRADARAVRAQEREDKNLQKIEDREGRLAVPGYARMGNVLPKDEEAVKFRKATASAEQMSQKLGRLRDLVKSHGSFEYGGEAGTEMESLATEIQLLGKSPELYELGVLAGPDLDLLTKITADPASMSSLFAQDSSRIKQIDTQMKSIAGKLASTAKSLGYEKANSLYPKQVRNGNKVATVNSPQEEAEAKAEGFN